MLKDIGCCRACSTWYGYAAAKLIRSIVLLVVLSLNQKGGRWLLLVCCTYIENLKHNNNCSIFKRLRRNLRYNLEKDALYTGENLLYMEMMTNTSKGLHCQHCQHCQVAC